MSSYIVLILIISTIVILAVYIVDISKSYHFICPNCNKEFKITAKKLLFTVHAFDEYNLKCPFCGKKNYMKQQN